MKISDRLRLIREHFDLTQPSAATKFGIPLGTYKQYEKGPSEPGSGALRGLAEGGININWLLTGEGEMLLADQTNNVEKAAPCQIDTKEFLRILERLGESDFLGHGLGKTYIGYYAALIYNRVMLQGEDSRELNLEAAIHDLNLYFMDIGIDRMEKDVTLAKEGKLDMPSEFIDRFQEDIYEYNKHLGSLRGKLRDRVMGPGTSFESKFIKGLGL